MLIVVMHFVYTHLMKSFEIVNMYSSDYKLLYEMVHVAKHANCNIATGTLPNYNFANYVL